MNDGAMDNCFQFDPSQLRVLVGGLSSMDLPQLNIKSKERALSFIRSYGYDLNRDEDLKKLWSYHSRSVTYIKSELLEEDQKFPEEISDPNKLEELSQLLIYASQKEEPLQRWACASLKVMHILVHLDNDLFSRFSTQIQEQILRPIQDHIVETPMTGVSLGTTSSECSVPLKKFSIKSFKRSGSSVTKLLAKPNEVAFRLLDKVGVRFVTKSVFDSFRVMKYLLENDIVNSAHIIPQESNNTIYPLELFFKVMEDKPKDINGEEIETYLKKHQQDSPNEFHYLRKENTFTNSNYHFIKWIGRRLIHIGEGKDKMSFFYPFEIQVIDYENYLQSLNGPSSHDEYKQRQKKRARLRILGK